MTPFHPPKTSHGGSVSASYVHRGDTDMLQVLSTHQYYGAAISSAVVVRGRRRSHLPVRAQRRGSKPPLAPDGLIPAKEGVVQWEARPLPGFKLHQRNTPAFLPMCRRREISIAPPWKKTC
jgi:urea transport system ATP-binding protein